MTAISLPQQIGVGSFGANSNTGVQFSSRSIFDSERFRELDRRQSYYDCTQHDLKRFDFDGRIVSTGSSATQPLISAEKFPGYVPLKMRRPTAPYRLARVIVNSFTNMLFGEQRFPSFKALGDNARQDWVQAVSRAAQLPVRMIRARNIGGAVGTVGVSWSFVDGKPRIEVHNGKNLYVHSWFDREMLLPRHVSEVYLYARDEWDNEKKRFMRNWYWYRRDWTPNEDIVFKEARYYPREEPVWEPDLDRSCAHQDGVTHFEWIQNLPSNEIDGLPDYDGLYEIFDSMDTLSSVIVRGATLNLDPTLQLKMDIDVVQRMGVKKGSDNALVVGKDGDASYLELQGGSITAGQALLDSMRRTALETAQCVVPDPNEVASQGISSVTIRALYAAMLGKCDIHREQYGTPMCRMLTRMADVAAARANRKVVVFNDAGEPVEATEAVTLPPRIEKTPALDENGEPTGEVSEQRFERDPGREGTEVEPQWGPYFMPTPDDLTKMAQMYSTTTGGKALQSQQSAVEQLAVFMGREPEDEWNRIKAVREDEQQQATSMFDDSEGGPGGKVEHVTQLPSGATVKRSRDFSAEKMAAAEAEAPDTGDLDVDENADVPDPQSSLSISPQDLAVVVTVNEARASVGLRPVHGPEGEMTIAEYKALRAKMVATATNAGQGKVGAAPAEPKPPGMGGPGGPPGMGGPPGPPKMMPGGPPGMGGPPGPPKPPGGAPPFGGKPAGPKPFGGPPGPPQQPPPKRGNPFGGDNEE